ncbi:MAG: aldo/keto reductase [Phycisphaeraceae bacterium]
MLRPLGKTSLRISPLGFGAFKIGRNEGIKYPSAYDLPDDKTVAHLLNGVLDLGINLIDTAPAYGLSEERIGKAIAHRREAFILSTKVGETLENARSEFDFSAPATRRSIERSLRRLRTDRLDIVFIHSDGDDERIMNETDCVATLMALRDEGVIGAIGLSGKTVDGAILALNWADVLMVEYHLSDRSHEPVIAEAAARGIGILVKKGLASGRLDPAQSIRFVLSNPGVSSLVIGGLNLSHIEANLATAKAMTI